jgi:glycosyltransferase involved in cell wall biosynthesis
MRILHAVLSRGFYGSERLCIELAAAQARAGHDVAVLIEGGDTPCARAFGQDIAATNAAIAADRGKGAIRLLIVPGGLPAVLHRPFALWTLIRFRPDIVHSHLNPAARRVGRVAQRLRIRHVATLHIRYEAREHAECDGVICGASWQHAEIGPEFRGTAAVVWPWLPGAVHAAIARVTAEEVAALRRSWTADDRAVVFGSIGRLMPEKGMDVLVRAFRAAFPAGTEAVRLVILGGGPPDEQQALRRLAAGEPRIVLIGAQPEIAPLYLAFDVYVSAARFEPFGLTILEAMDAGCTLVVTCTQGPREFLKDTNVLWTEPDDVAGLAAQLAAAVPRGKQRPAYDLTPFAPARGVAAIEEFYRRVIARRP